jgi:hypothetical protein
MTENKHCTKRKAHGLKKTMANISTTYSGTKSLDAFGQLEFGRAPCASTFSTPSETQS